MLGIHLIERTRARRFRIVLAIVACVWTARLAAQTQEIPINLDEAKVGPYTLPGPLNAADGKKVSSRDAWIQQRRPELLRIFEDQMYGKVPRPDKPLHI